jgi:hypothetical protein
MLFKIIRGKLGEFAAERQRRSMSCGADNPELSITTDNGLKPVLQITPIF